MPVVSSASKIEVSENCQKNCAKILLLNGKDLKKFRIIFDGENWLLKSDLGTFGQMSIYKIQ